MWSYGFFNGSFYFMADFSFRYDGSSSFPKDSRWGFFPAVSAGWRISEEAFMKEWIPFLSNLKLRASYGEMGDDGGANTYPQTAVAYSINKDQLGYFYNGKYMIVKKICFFVLCTIWIGLTSCGSGGSDSIPPAVEPENPNNPVPTDEYNKPDFIPHGSLGIIHRSGKHTDVREGYIISHLVNFPRCPFQLFQSVNSFKVYHIRIGTIQSRRLICSVKIDHQFVFSCHLSCAMVEINHSLIVPVHGVPLAY